MSKRLAIWIGLALALAALHVALMPFTTDDAYIHLRIAENLAHHGKPYYNLDERVMSTSAPLWTAFVALLTLLSPAGKALYLVAVFNGLFVAAGAWAWTQLLRELLPTRKITAAVALFAVVYVGAMLPSSKAMMEAPAALCLAGAALLLIVRGRVVAFALLAAAVFLRAELVILLGFALAVVVWRQRSRLPMALASCGMVLLAGCGLVFLAFGTIAPNTVKAKEIVYALRSEETFVAVFASVGPVFEQSLLRTLLGERMAEWYAGVRWVIQPALFLLAGAVGALALPQRRRDGGPWEWGLAIGLAGLAAAAAYTQRHVLLFPWYPPVFVVPLTLAAFWLAGAAGRWGWALLAALSAKPLVMIALLTAGAMGRWDQVPGAMPELRAQRYLEVGTVLREVFPDATLATSEIGGLGYGFKGRVIDGVGLITPDALKYHPMEVPRQRRYGHIGAIPAAFIADNNPELVVSYPFFAEEFATSASAGKYVLMKIPALSALHRQRLRSDAIFGSKWLYLWIRSDLATPVARAELAEAFAE